MNQTGESYIELVRKLRREYLEYPSTISIETKSHCNAACSFCPYISLERKGTELPDYIIDKIADEISTFPDDHNLNIVLARVNETFLDKRWFSISRKLLEAKNNITFGFFSNGSTVTQNNIEKLNNLSNVQYFNISLNYSDPDEHFKNMKLRFDKIINNLDSLHHLKMNGGFSPLVVVSRVGSADHRDDEFREFVSSRYPKFRVKIAPKSNWIGNVHVDKKTDIPSTPCRQWFQLHILANGRQAFCCIDAEGEQVDANIYENTLLEIYNNPQLVSIRKNLPADRKPKHAVHVCCCPKSVILNEIREPL